jgi:septal ring factor EnvC (AmiA/AmiB activator)
MWGKSSHMASRSWWARFLRFSSRGLSCIVLLSVLCLTSWPTFGESSPPPAAPSPISISETTQMRLDLSTLIAQRNYWKDRSDNFEQAAKQIGERLRALEQSLQDSPDPQTLLAEIADLRKQLADALSSLAESKASLASLDGQIAGAADKVTIAEKKAQALERENGWLKVGIVVAVVVAAGAATYAAVK